MILRKAGQEDIKALCHLMKELSGHDISFDQMINRLQFIKGSNPTTATKICERH